VWNLAKEYVPHDLTPKEHFSVLGATQ